MSWRGFQKAVARFPQQIGGGTKTHDEEFDDLESQLKNLEACAGKLRGDAEKFKNAVLASLDHQEKMAEVLSEVFTAPAMGLLFQRLTLFVVFSGQAYQPIPSRLLTATGEQKTLTQASDESQRVVQEYAEAMRTAKDELIPELVCFFDSFVPCRSSARAHHSCVSLGPNRPPNSTTHQRFP